MKYKEISFIRNLKLFVFSIFIIIAQPMEKLWQNDNGLRHLFSLSVFHL